MRRTRIFSAQPLQQGAELELEQRNLHYLLHVLRVTAGTDLILFDGSGSDYRAAVSGVGRKSVSVRVLEKCSDGEVRPESPLHTQLAIAISKGERMDWVMQKATEMGVSTIQPLLTSRVDVKLNAERAEKKLLHWRSIVVSACEQSGRSVVPEVTGLLRLQQWLNVLPESDYSQQQARLMLGAGGLSFRTVVERFSAAPNSACVLIGSEGGLDDNEVSCAEAAGFIATAFGPRILRTETAPVVALGALQQAWGDF